MEGVGEGGAKLEASGGRPQAELTSPPPLPPLVPGVCLGVGIHPFPGLPQPQPI